MRWCLTLAALLTLAACASPRTLVAPPDKPRLDAPDSTTIAACAGPERARHPTLTQAETEALLGRNADRLMDCAERHRILVDYIRTRDAALTSGEP